MADAGRMGDLADQSSYDPFAAEQFVNPVVDAMGRGLAQTVMAPGQLMQPNPYQEGGDQSKDPYASELASWYDDQRDKGAVDWGRDTALGMVGSPGLAGGMEGATLGSGIAKAPKAALDMSQEARMARAAEQGFDTSKTLYHGTSNEFDKFKTNRAGITVSNRQAGNCRHYANIRYEAGQRANAQALGLDVNAGPNVLPVYAKAKNPLVISDQGPGGRRCRWTTTRRLALNTKAVRRAIAICLRKRASVDTIRSKCEICLISEGTRRNISCLTRGHQVEVKSIWILQTRVKNMILGSGTADAKEPQQTLQGIRAYHLAARFRCSTSPRSPGEGAQGVWARAVFAENPAVSGQGGQYWNQFHE